MNRKLKDITQQRVRQLESYFVFILAEINFFTHLCSSLRIFFKLKDSKYLRKKCF